MKNIIQIPRKELLEGKEFYADSLDKALSNCQKEGFEAVFMPKLIDARIEAPKDVRIWQTWYSAPSIRATGKTKQGTPVVVYAHTSNFFSNPENIKKARENLVRGAGIMPEKEFQTLIDLEDNLNVFVVDYNALKNSKSDVIPLKAALKHPQTIPFVGGKERAEAYLARHKEVYGDGGIGIWHSDDLHDEPLGRLLFLGYLYHYPLYYYLLGGDSNLNLSGRFVGVRAEGAALKKQVPTKEQITRIISEYTASVNKKELEKRISALYK